ncbi:MAG: alpha/beta fold hydrolase [Nakamurella sp.]
MTEQPNGTAYPRAGYVEVAGLQTWREVSGEGEPVALLHGAFAGATSWFAQVPALVAAGYQVHAVERRAHAHTPDVEGPLTYSIMAEDTIAYLEQELSRPAHLVGWSDGAVVGLLVAQRRPDLVERLVLIGQYYNSTGKVAGSMLAQLLASDSEAMQFLRGEYDAVSPDGAEHFPVVYAKTMQMISTEPEIDLETLTRIQSPCLVLQGDQDEVTVAHSMAVVGALPDGRLAVLPGTHALPVESPEPVNSLLISFLRGGPQPARWGA